MKHTILLISFFLQYYTLKAQDTIPLREYAVFMDTSSDMDLDIHLLENKFEFDGYLIVKIDRSISTDTTTNVGNRLFFATIFWVNDIQHIENINERYHYKPVFETTMSYYKLLYQQGQRDSSTMFFFYYNLFNSNSDALDKTYLYRGYKKLSSNDLANVKSVFTNDLENEYVLLFRCKFSAAIFADHNNRKCLIPISTLKEFRYLDTLEMQLDNLKKNEVVISIIK